MLGIEAAKKVELFLLDVASSVVKSLEDGKFDLGDVFNFVQPLMELEPALSAVKDVPPELADLSLDEGMELISLAASKFPQLDEKKVKILKASLKLVVDGVELYHAVKG